MENQLTRSFRINEDNMACPCCNAIVPDMTFLNRVQVLRDIMDTPFNLTKKGGGFYRCRDFNDSIGGAKNSQHLLGNAMDVLTWGWDGNTKWKFIREATSLGFSVGIYESFFHIDYRKGLPVTWL